MPKKVAETLVKHEDFKAAGIGILVGRYNFQSGRNCSSGSSIHTGKGALRRTL